MSQINRLAITDMFSNLQKTHKKERKIWMNRLFIQIFGCPDIFLFFWSHQNWTGSWFVPVTSWLLTSCFFMFFQLRFADHNDLQIVPKSKCLDLSEFFLEDYTRIQLVNRTPTTNQVQPIYFLQIGKGSDRSFNIRNIHILNCFSWLLPARWFCLVKS